MSPILVQLLLALFNTTEPVLKQFLVDFLKKLDADATNATEKLFLEAFLKFIGD